MRQLQAQGITSRFSTCAIRNVLCLFASLSTLWVEQAEPDDGHGSSPEAARQLCLGLQQRSGNG